MLKPVKVLIADDHAIVREGLKRILQDAPEVEVVAEAADGRDVQRLLREHAIDLVLLDISMPGRNGLETLAYIRATRPALPVLVLSMYPEEQYALRMMKAGADGYLTKESAPDQLVKALRDVAAGRKYASPELISRLVGELNAKPAGPPHETLSDREFSVLIKIATGKTLTGIAEELNLSIKTISTHRTRILKKLQLRNNIELSQYAVRHGLVT